jgi:hypothetical protein
MDMLDAVRRRVWASRFYELPAEAASVPTMLTSEEGKMLAWLGEHYFQGQGAVVDLGSFLGGSSVRLASGLERSGRAWTMHCYDRFTIDENLKKRYLYSAGHPEFEGLDMFHVFNNNVEQFAPKVIAHQGDIVSSPWTKDPVEILFIDLANNVKTYTFVLANFFSSLIPGRSLIVQHDYIYFRLPWVVAAMELLHPKIELVSWTDESSAVFLCNEAPDAADLERVRFDRLPQSVVEYLILSARDRFPFEWQREMFAVMLDCYRRSPNETRAWAYPQMNMKQRPSVGPWSE